MNIQPIPTEINVLPHLTPHGNGVVLVFSTPQGTCAYFLDHDPAMEVIRSMRATMRGMPPQTIALPNGGQHVVPEADEDELGPMTERGPLPPADDTLKESAGTGVIMHPQQGDELEGEVGTVTPLRSV